MDIGETELLQIIRTHSSPLRPLPAQLPPSLSDRLNRPLPTQPAAVLLDIYGTLFVSGSGDIGSTSAPEEEIAALAWERVLGSPPDPGCARHLVVALNDAILAEHEKHRSLGALQPEVDVRQIWAEVLSAAGPCQGSQLPDPDQYSVAYETAANPVWPMPDLDDFLQTLKTTGLPMGIVSNAQFYTPLLFNALLGKDPEKLGFDRNALAYSFMLHRAKPDPGIFDGPLAYLQERGIDSEQVVYLGNDMLNDVVTAGARGCMTVLFAGDKRSLRIRENDERVARKQPDSVVASLTSFAELVSRPEE